MGKATVAPIKRVTIPLLELTAAVVAVKWAQTLQFEFRYNEVQHFFISDSKVVLGYVANRSLRFFVFVANRVNFIQHIRMSTSGVMFQVTCMLLTTVADTK